jgi:hypothetical protein
MTLTFTNEFVRQCLQLGIDSKPSEAENGCPLDRSGNVSETRWLQGQFPTAVSRATIAHTFANLRIGQSWQREPDLDPDVPQEYETWR